MKVLVSNLMMLHEKDRFRKILVEKGIEPVFPEVDQFLSEDELLEMVGDFDGWLAGDDKITRKILKKSLPKLRVISKWGTGLDSIDLVAGEEFGIPIYNSPGAFKDAVAEVAIAYMLNLTRHICLIDRAVRKGEWIKPSGDGLTGKKLGLIGFGAIGQGIAKRAIGMGMSIFAHDIVEIKFDKEFVGVVQLELDQLLKQADIICLACNMTADNHHMIDNESIKRMKKGVFIINVARGPLICTKDMISFLQAGHIAGVGLDVYEEEPFPMNSPLVKMDNVILGSHNANNLKSATEFVHKNTLENLYAGLNIKD